MSIQLLCAVLTIFVAASQLIVRGLQRSYVVSPETIESLKDFLCLAGFFIAILGVFCVL